MNTTTLLSKALQRAETEQPFIDALQGLVAASERQAAALEQLVALVREAKS